MERRLRTVLLLLLCLLVGSLTVPFAVVLANDTQQRVITDRLADAERFAALAAHSDDAALDAELTRYERVYGIEAAYILRDGAYPRGARHIPGADEGVVEAALSGRHVTSERRFMPVGDEPLTVAVPVMRRGDVVGAIVSVSALGGLHGRMWVAWAVLAVGVLMAIGAAVLAARGITRWVLRPVMELTTAVRRVASETSGVQVPASTGPPELRDLTDSFNTMSSSVARTLERQRAFVADASHQLRNPLNALMLRYEVLAMDLPGPEPEEIEALRYESRRMLSILDRLLEAAAIEERGATPAARGESADAAAVAAERVGVFRMRAPDHVLAVRVPGQGRAGGDAEGVWAGMDRDELADCLDALLDNAAKYAPAGTRITTTVARVDIGASSQDAAEDTTVGRAVAVTVDDQGGGMTPEELARVGDRFWRAERHRDVMGTGLGLSIVAETLDVAGGRLEVSNNDIGGLRVRMVVPPAVGPPPG